MTEATLERRCRLLARAYRDRSRADEVLTTLMESNEGRRSPRPADVVNVLWHGLRTRLGNTAPEARFGQWGDAAAAAVVQLALVQAATALALTRWVTERPLSDWVARYGGRVRPQYEPVFFSGYEQGLALGVAALSVVTAAAVCLGRVRTARAAAALTATVGVGGVLASRGTASPLTLRTSALALVVAMSVVVAVAVVGTTAVARARRSVPGFWWGTAGMAALPVATWAVHWGWVPFDSRPGLVVFAVGLVAGLLLLLSVPLARQFQGAVGGSTMLAAALMPVITVALQRWATGALDTGVAVAASLAGWIVVAALMNAALRSRATSPDR